MRKNLKNQEPLDSQTKSTKTTKVDQKTLSIETNGYNCYNIGSGEKYSVNKYLNKDLFKATIIDAVHEWKGYSDILKKKNIDLIIKKIT